MIETAETDARKTNKPTLLNVEKRLREIEQSITDGVVAEPGDIDAAKLTARIETIENNMLVLTNCLSMMAHYSGGNLPRIMEQHNIPKYQPTAEDKRRYRG